MALPTARTHSTIERGLSQCTGFLDEDKKEEWEREALEARRHAVEHEMTQLRLDDVTVETIAATRGMEADTDAAR